jgi:hypothetical protein
MVNMVIRLTPRWHLTPTAFEFMDVLVIQRQRRLGGKIRVSSVAKKFQMPGLQLCVSVPRWQNQ